MRVRSFSAKFLYPSQKQKQPSFEDCFFRQFSLFCLVITLYNVKGYAAFHKTSTADAVPEVFCSLATSQSIFALQKSLLRRTCFAARNRLTAENDRTLIARHRLFSVIFSFRLGGRQPACVSKRKNSSKISLWRVRAVFTVRIFVITTKKPQ